MKRLTLGIASALSLAACASTVEVTDAERRINDLADESSRGAPFPVLGPLPTRQDVIGEGIGEDVAEDLRTAAADLEGLRQSAAANRRSLTTEETVEELQALVARLQNDPGVTAPPVDIDALGFPTPPPRN